MSCSESEAVVVRVEGDWAVVRLAQTLSSCGRCDQPGGCGKSALIGGGERLVPVPNDVAAHVGDAVVLSVPDGAVLRAAAWAYLMPAVLAIAGAAGGTQLAGDGYAAVAGAVAGLLGGVVLLRILPSRKPALAMRIKSF